MSVSRLRVSEMLGIQHNSHRFQAFCDVFPTCSFQLQASAPLRALVCLWQPSDLTGDQALDMGLHTYHCTSKANHGHEYRNSEADPTLETKRCLLKCPCIHWIRSSGNCGQCGVDILLDAAN